MKQEVSPAVIIAVGAVAVVILVGLVFYALKPHPEKVTIPPPSLMNEGAAKRHNIEKARSGMPGGNASGGPVDRTGD